MLLTLTVTLVGLILGPVLAEKKKKWIERSADRKSRQLYIFRVLMATRSTPVVSEHVTALNLIDIDFSKKKKKEKPIIDTWQILQNHLDNGYPNYNDYEDKTKYTNELNISSKKSREFLDDLLNEMSKFLSYDFEKIIIKRDSYFPSGFAEKENDDSLIRKGVIAFLYGYGSASLSVKDSPEPTPNKTIEKLPE